MGNNVGDLIAKRPEVAKMDFISAQEAWESFRDEYLMVAMDASEKSLLRKILRKPCFSV